MLRLPSEMSSVRTARHWVGSKLAGWSDEGRHVAVLVASELVANAMLHARTNAEVSVELAGSRCRLAVVDRDTRLPVVKRYDDLAPTGRGLRLVGCLSQEWGMRARPGGKEVWAVLGDGEPGQDRAPTVEAGPATEGPDWEDSLEVVLLAVPLSAFTEAQAHNDELMREFAFMAGSRHPISQRLAQVVEEVWAFFLPASDGIRSDVERAAAGGRNEFDLRVRMSRAGWESLQRLSALLDEIDAFCDRAELLTLASSPTVRLLRRWYREEVRRQVSGLPAGPWPGL